MKKTFAVFVVVVLLFTLVSPMAFASEAPSMMEPKLEVEAGLTINSPLYFLDEWMEGAQLSLETDDEKVKELLSEFAQERIAEVVVLSDKAGQEDHINSTINNYENLVEQLEEKAEAVESEEEIIEEVAEEAIEEEPLENEDVEEEQTIPEEGDAQDTEDGLEEGQPSEEEELEEENAQEPLTKARNAILVLTKVQEKLEQKNNMNASAAISRNIAKLEAKLLIKLNNGEEDALEEEEELEDENIQGNQEDIVEIEEIVLENTQDVQATQLIATKANNNKASKEEKVTIKAEKKEEKLEKKAEKKEQKVEKKAEKAEKKKEKNVAAKAKGNNKGQKNSNNGKKNK